MIFFTRCPLRNVLLYGVVVYSTWNITYEHDLRIRIIKFSELAVFKSSTTCKSGINQTSSLLHQKINCSRHDITVELITCGYTTIIHSLYNRHVHVLER